MIQLVPVHQSSQNPTLFLQTEVLQRATVSVTGKILNIQKLFTETSFKRSVLLRMSEQQQQKPETGAWWHHLLLGWKSTPIRLILSNNKSLIIIKSKDVERPEWISFKEFIQFYPRLDEVRGHDNFLWFVILFQLLFVLLLFKAGVCARWGKQVSVLQTGVGFTWVSCQGTKFWLFMLHRSPGLFLSASSQRTIAPLETSEPLF